MLKDKKIDLIIIISIILAIIITLLFINGDKFGIKKITDNPAYEERLFDTSFVHNVDIIIDVEDWKDLLENPKEKNYYNSTVIIDGEAVKNVGLRAKGKNSLRQIDKYNSPRFSLKIEFDHFQKGKNYFGLDKLSLNSSFQDNAYLKDFIAYDMMRFMDVPAPLTSYGFVKINGEDWGLFVLTEEIEDAFAKRNFGSNHGSLYKPEYRSLEDENNDIALIYTDDNHNSYDGIFRKSKFNIDDNDKNRLIDIIKKLNNKEDLDRILFKEELLRYFVVQTFVVNLDSYIGYTGHNYYLYEEDGRMTILPWDYNLAFATYMLGRKNPINDSTLFVNYPIDTPAPLEVMEKRPLFINLMEEPANKILYHSYYREFIDEYFNSGYFDKKLDEIFNIISPYVEKDPIKFISYEKFLKGYDTFREFCNLRKESVEGQINGDIPSTFKGQSENPKNKIDASHISVPDMGNLKDMR